MSGLKHLQMEWRRASDNLIDFPGLHFECLGDLSATGMEVLPV